MIIKRPPNIKDPELNRIINDIYSQLTQLANEVDKFKITTNADKGVVLQVKDKKGVFKTDNLTAEN